MNIIEWRDALLDSSMDYKAKLIGLVLSQFYRNSNQTYPSIRTLSNLSGLTINPVQKGIQILLDNNFIHRKKKRLAGDRYLSNIYSFCGVTESGHVSPGDTSHDTSHDTSPGDTEIVEEDKVEREAHSLFKNKILNEEMKKFAEDKGVFGKQLETSWQRFLIKKGNAMIERQCSYEEFFADWQLWILNERVEDVSQEEGKALKGDELLAQQLGAVLWLRERKMFVTERQEKDFASFEELSGIKVTWRNCREWRNQGAIPLNYERHTRGKSP